MMHIKDDKRNIQAEISDLGKNYKGVNFARIEANKIHGFNETEEAFYETWKSEYAKDQSTLTQMKSTMRDRVVVATVVQWLGSNVGIGFLSNVLGKCGYCIVKKSDRITRISDIYGI